MPKTAIYSYYREVTSKSHFKTASELATELSLNYQMTSLTGGILTRLVSAYLNSRLNQEEKPRLFYSGKHGMIQVFQNGSRVGDLATDLLYKATILANSKGILNHADIVLTIEDKNYHVKVPKDSFLLPLSYRYKPQSVCKLTRKNFKEYKENLQKEFKKTSATLSM